MIGTLIIYVCISLGFASSIWFGIREKRRVDTLEQFFIFGEGFPKREFAATLVATNAGLASAFVLILYYGFFYGLAVFPWVWLFWLLTQVSSRYVIERVESRFLGGWFAKGGTLHELIGDYYGSPRARAYAGTLSVLAYMGLISCEVVLAYELMKAVLAGMPELSFVHPSLVVFSFVVCIAIYAALAGFRGVAKTDLLQLVFITLMLAAVSIFLMANWSEVRLKYPSIYAPLSSGFLNPDRRGYGFYLSFLASNIIFWGAWWPVAMDQWQRCAAARSIQGALSPMWGTTGLIPTLFFGLISLVFVAAGCFLKLTLAPDVSPSPGLLADLASSVSQAESGGYPYPCAVLLYICILTGLIFAAISTIDTYLITATQSLCVDVLNSRRTNNLLELSQQDTDRSVLLQARRVTILLAAVVVLCASAIALLASDIYEFIYASFSCQFAILPALYGALFGRGFTARAAERSLLTGLLLSIVGGAVIIAMLETASKSGSESFIFWMYQIMYWWPIITGLIGCAVLRWSQSAPIRDKIQL